MLSRSVNDHEMLCPDLYMQSRLGLDTNAMEGGMGFKRHGDDTSLEM